MGVSIVLHASLFLVGGVSWQLHHKPIVEIDLTQPVRVGRVTSTKPAPLSVKAPPSPPMAPTPSEFAKIATSEPMPATPASAPAAADDSATLSKLPQLKNLAELGPLLQHYYPERERMNHQEGVVTVEIVINEEGRVVDASVMESSAEGFDKAAVRVAKLLRFTPALRGAEKVGIRMRQTFAFKIES